MDLTAKYEASTKSTVRRSAPVVSLNRNATCSKTEQRKDAMADEPHARKDGTTPVLSDDFTAGSVEELVEALGTHLVAAGLKPEVVAALGAQIKTTAAEDGTPFESRVNRGSIPTEMKPEDSDLLVSGLKILEGVAESLGIDADLNPASIAGETIFHGSAPEGESNAGSRLMQRELGGTEIHLQRREDREADAAPADPLEPDVLIVGGAAAGLTAAACLLHAGVEKVVVVEKGARPGDNWKRRYDRLHLHDIIDECHLPYMQMPDNFPTFPTRVQYGNYLQAYQIALGINVLAQSTVSQATKAEDGRWDVDVLDESASPRTVRYRPRAIVGATGLFPQTQPNRPAVAGQDEYQGEVLHTVDYHSGARFKGKKVLLVGFGNSANDVCCDLWEEGAETSVVIRSPVSLVPRSLWMFIETLTYRAHWLRRLVADQIPGAREGVEPWRECFSVDPVEATAEVEAVMKVVDSLAKYIARREFASIEGKGVTLSEVGPIECLAVHGEAPVIDVGAARLIMRDDVSVITQPLSRFTPTGVEFEGGRKEDYDAVVFATGFQMASGHYDWLDRELSDMIGRGKPALEAGLQPFAAEVPSIPGLFTFYGRLQMLREGGPRMATDIAKFLQQASL